MAGDNAQRRGRSGGGNGGGQESAPPRPRTRFIYKLLGFVLVLLAAYLAWDLWRHGRLRDLTDAAQQRDLAQQVKADYHDLAQWADEHLKDLKQRFSGPPPETKDDTATLVRQAQQEAGAGSTTSGAAAHGASANGKTGAQTGKAASPPAEAPPAGAAGPALSALDKARVEYRHGTNAYALTSPDAPQPQVEKDLHLAAAHFERCLFWLDQARLAGTAEGQITPLEQPAAKRLYDCRKRMTVDAAPK